MVGQSDEDEAALERGREAFRLRNATPEAERTKFPRPERFSDFAIGFDDEGNELMPTIGEQETGDTPPYEPSDENKAIIEKAEASWARRKTIPSEERHSTARREHFEGPPLGSDAEGNIAARRPENEH
jgi:hypothetical protein